jgi:hypothetical protein
MISDAADRAQTNAQALLGCWSLAAFEERGADGQWRDALTGGAHGYINYWPTGEMSVVIGGGERPRFRGSWEEIAAGAKAAALDDLVAYGGTYSVAADRVTHHLTVCWIPNWEGRDLVRLVSFPEPGELLLETVPFAEGGPPREQRVLWRKP